MNVYDLFRWFGRESKAILSDIPGVLGGFEADYSTLRAKRPELLANY